MPGPTYVVSVLGTGDFYVEGGINGTYKAVGEPLTKERPRLLAEAIAQHARLHHGVYRVENLPAALSESGEVKRPLHQGVFRWLADHIGELVKRA